MKKDFDAPAKVDTIPCPGFPRAFYYVILRQRQAETFNRVGLTKLATQLTDWAKTAQRLEKETQA